MTSDETQHPDHGPGEAAPGAPSPALDRAATLAAGVRPIVGTPWPRPASQASPDETDDPAASPSYSTVPPQWTDSAPYPPAPPATPHYRSGTAPGPYGPPTERWTPGETWDSGEATQYAPVQPLWQPPVPEQPTYGRQFPDQDDEPELSHGTSKLPPTQAWHPPTRPEPSLAEPPAYQPGPAPGLPQGRVVPLPPQRTRVPGASLAASPPADYPPPAYPRSFEADEPHRGAGGSDYQHGAEPEPGLDQPYSYAEGPHRERGAFHARAVPLARTGQDGPVTARVSVPQPAHAPEPDQEPQTHHESRADAADAAPPARGVSASASVPLASRGMAPRSYAIESNAMPAPQPRVYGRPAAVERPEDDRPEDDFGDLRRVSRPAGDHSPTTSAYAAPRAASGTAPVVPPSWAGPDAPIADSEAPFPATAVPQRDRAAPDGYWAPGPTEFGRGTGQPDRPANSPNPILGQRPAAAAGRASVPPPVSPAPPAWGPAPAAPQGPPTHGFAAHPHGPGGPDGLPGQPYGVPGQAGATAPHGWGDDHGQRQLTAPPPQTEREPGERSEPDAPAPQVRNGRVLAAVLAAALLLLVVPLGIVWLVTRPGDDAFNPNVGECVKQSGSGAVVAACSEQGAFSVAAKVDNQDQCADKTQPHIVVTGSGGKKQVLCLVPVAGR